MLVLRHPPNPNEPVRNPDLAVGPMHGPTKVLRLRSVGEIAARIIARCWCWCWCVVLCCVVWLALWSIVPAVVGWTSTVVAGGSMSSSLRPGAIVQVDRGADPESLLAGAITTFDNPAVEGMRVTHRIAGVQRLDGVLTGFRTKGDANATPDSTIVPV